MTGEMRPASLCTEAEIQAMYALMEVHYDNTDPAVFRRDLHDKDYVLLLHEGGEIVGFTTQKLVTVPLNGRKVQGVFSGDTIIRRDLWGDTELFRTWAQFWFPYAEAHGELYWFLICKGYKTYRILPLFWREFYPSRRKETPPEMQEIMDAYASQLYPDDYNPQTGVIEYRHAKDRLRFGIADIDEKQLRHPDTAYFAERNPGHAKGNDLVCLARIDRSCMRPQTERILFG
ncbi:MAG: hypothetical protein IJ825_05030 [Oscillospiraceae bacterium]|nr:hypothetical protein [Oscillospiraceae bacterium]